MNLKTYSRRWGGFLAGAMVVATMLSACGAADTPTPAAAPTTAPTAAVAGPTDTAAMAGPTNTAAAAAPTDTAGATGATATPAAAAASTPTAVPTVPQAAGSTKITFWYGLTGFNGAIVQGVINKYNSSQSKYYIEGIQQPDYDGTINKLNASLAGGDLPNIVQIYDIGTQRMIDTKRIIPVQTFLDKENSTLKQDIEPAVASYFTVNGTLYSMPFNSSAPVLYYDKTAFKEAGLDPEKPPTTYDEVMADAQKLTKKDASGNVTRVGIEFTLYGWVLEQELATQGALYAKPDNGRNGRATSLVFNEQEGQNWLNFLKQLQDAGVGKSVGRASGTTNGTTMGADFSKGSAAMALESIAVLRSWAAQAKTSGSGVDVGVGYLPKPAGAPGGVIIGGASLWITDQGTADQQAGAWDFIKFATQPEQQAYFASNTGYYPMNVKAYDQPLMKDALAKYPQFQIAVNELHDTKASVATAGAVFGTFAGTRVTVEGAMEDVMLGKSQTKDALDAAASDANAKLEEYNATVK